MDFRAFVSPLRCHVNFKYLSVFIYVFFFGGGWWGVLGVCGKRIHRFYQMLKGYGLPNHEESLPLRVSTVITDRLCNVIANATSILSAGVLKMQLWKWFFRNSLLGNTQNAIWVKSHVIQTIKTLRNASLVKLKLRADWFFQICKFFPCSALIDSGTEVER